MWIRPSGLALIVLCGQVAIGEMTSEVISIDRQGNDLRGQFAGPITALASPAPIGSAGPHLATDARGRVWLGWLEPRAGGGHRFRLARLEGTAWSDPVTVAEGTNFLANWADVPSVFISANGTLAAHWLERGAERSAYGIRLRTSADAGRTWTAPVTPHRDGPAGEHGFVSFFEAPGAGLGLVWLDGRDERSMTLRASTVTAGKTGDETVVDPRVCECCPTSAARTANGVIVAYRDRSENDVRDISVVRFAGGAWSAPVTVHRDAWQINGCPVNGPVVAASGNTVAVAWFTVAGGTPHTYVSFSTDGGVRFGEPFGVDVDPTLGRLAMVMADANRVLVSSLERSAGGPRLVVRAVGRDGRASQLAVIADTSADRQSGFARMAVSGTRVVFAWTDFRAGSPTSVKVATSVLQ